MQKKLIALVIAGVASGTAFAQSNVTISGQLKAGYERYKITGNGNGQAGTQNMFSDQTSSIVLKGEENLGNGLTAIFQIDNRFTVDTGNTSLAALSTTAGAGATGALGGGNTWLGIKSKSFGEIKLGRQDLHYNESERLELGARSLSQQVLVSRAILGQVDGNAVGPNATRTSNVLFWDSPNWSGVTARVAYSTNPYGQEGPTTGAQDNGNAKNFVLRYENGPLKTGVSHYRQTAEDGGAGAYNGADAKQVGTRAWAGYKIGGFSFGLIYDRSSVGERITAGTTDGKKTRTGWAIPLAFQTGNHGIYFTYGKVGDYKSEVNGKVNQSGAKQIALGYDYSLSKRTSVGVNYAVLRNDSGHPDEGDYAFANLAGKGTATNANNPGGGEKASQFYVGVRHAY